ncbi:MAG: hypothetical protein V4515_12480 [Chloroflexota bacterium]
MLNTDPFAAILTVFLGGVATGIAIDRLVLLPLVMVRAAWLRRHGG